jgi:hypothetical protein
MFLFCLDIGIKKFMKLIKNLTTCFLFRIPRTQLRNTVAALKSSQLVFVPILGMSIGSFNKIHLKANRHTLECRISIFFPEKSAAY